MESEKKFSEVKKLENIERAVGFIFSRCGLSSTGYGVRKQTKNGEQIFQFTLNQDNQAKGIKVITHKKCKSRGLNFKISQILLTLVKSNFIIKKRLKMVIIKEINSETITIQELKDFVGKKVRINIEELVEERDQIEIEHKPLGRYKLGRELDRLNIRDFAYEEN